MTDLLEELRAEVERLKGERDFATDVIAKAKAAMNERCEKAEAERDAAIAARAKAEAALAKVREALMRITNAVGEMKHPKDIADVALLVTVTVGPALTHAQDVLASLTEGEPE